MEAYQCRIPEQSPGPAADEAEVARLKEEPARLKGAAPQQQGCRPGWWRPVVALAEYRTSIRVGVVGIAALAHLLQDHPTGGTALTFVIVTAVLLLVLEELAAPQPSPAAANKRLQWRLTHHAPRDCASLNR